MTRWKFSEVASFIISHQVAVCEFKPKQSLELNLSHFLILFLIFLRSAFKIGKVVIPLGVNA